MINLKYLFTLFFLSILFSCPVQGVDTRDLTLKKKSAKLFRVLSLTNQKDPFQTTIKRFSPKSILFLGDADHVKRSNFFSLAQTHKEFFRNFEIETYQTDLRCPNIDETETGIKKRKVNHRKRFPFEDNQFNIILGSRIICACDRSKPNETCGGLSLKNNSYLLFFSEILRVLRKKKNSFAYINGYDFKFSPWHSKQTDKKLKLVRDSLANIYPKLKYFRIVYQSVGEEKKRLGVILGNAEVWKPGYWSRSCTACPANLYKAKHCLSSEILIDERSCDKAGCRGFCLPNKK